MANALGFNAFLQEALVYLNLNYSDSVNERLSVEYLLNYQNAQGFFPSDLGIANAPGNQDFSPPQFLLYLLKSGQIEDDFLKSVFERNYEFSSQCAKLNSSIFFLAWNVRLWSLAALHFKSNKFAKFAISLLIKLLSHYQDAINWSCWFL